MKPHQKESNYNLFKLQQQPNNLELIRFLIQQQNGQLVFLIHPFFHQLITGKINRLDSQASVKKLQDTNTEIFPHKADPNSLSRQNITQRVTEVGTRGYYHRLRNFLVHSNTFLVALGEHTLDVSTTIKLLRAFGYTKNLLFYETDDGDPRPDSHVGTWDMLTQKIAEIQPKKIIVAGQLSSDSESGGCVHEFANNIKSRLSGAEVVISPVVYPNWMK